MDQVAREPQSVKRLQDLVRATPIAGYLGCCEAIRDMDHREILHKITAPTLITVGDCDAVRLDHALRFLRLRGGDVNGDFAGVPASQLAVLPGTTHFFGLARTALVLDVVLPFLDADMPSR